MVATLALVASAAGFAHAEPIFKLTDARGDDDGNGALIYPNRDDLQRGDLIVLTIGEPMGKSGGTNAMKIVRVGEHRSTP